MHTLVHLTGDFSVSQLKDIASKVEVLANQPPMEIHIVYADKNPQLAYREIFVSRELKIIYHVMDMGHIKNVPDGMSIGDKIYSGEEVEELMNKE
jgi:hypothetical protein